MTLQEGIEIICREMKSQSRKHRESALKRVGDYYRNNTNLNNLIEGVRLEVTAEALDGIAKALSVDKIKEWRDRQEKKD